MKKTIVHLLLLVLVLSGCSTTPPEKNSSLPDEEHYQQGIAEMNRRYYSEAVKHFEELREKFPLSPYAVMALLRMAECQYLDKNYIEAQYSFENFRRLHPSHEQVEFSL